MADAPIRYTKGKASVELSWLRYLLLIPLWWLLKPYVQLLTAELRAVVYHPIAIVGIALVLAVCVVSPWLVIALVLAMPLWAREWPDSYRHHATPRMRSFIAGFGYRWKLRKKLTGSRLLNEKEPLPTISWVSKVGCITTVRIKMSYGDNVDFWRTQLTAQTFNALDVSVNPYRRKHLLPWRDELVTLPRWLKLEFLTKDPFTSKLGVEYIDFHKSNTFTPVVATDRSGVPHKHELAAHRLRVAMTRWGKSNAIRAMVYAQRHNIEDGLLELWGIDGKGGVEQSFLQHVFARVAYGDTDANPNAYDPAEFDQLLKDAVDVLKKRQRGMRGFVTEHIPTPSEPWLLIVIDEILVLTSKAVPPEIRNSIAASIMLIQQQGIACGVSLDASTQLAQKEKLEFRDGFTEFEVGKVERGAVDMIFGTGWWERGARADEIAKDLKGVFYKKTDTTMVPEQIRYPNVPVADVSPKALGFTVEKSVLMKELDAVEQFGFG
jgi:S-DNA-T family DNA segregation ATPase FtsK/SpoIIIE